MNMPRILVIIPCFNEQDSIQGLLHEVAALNQNYTTLVIDDGSRDATYERARPLSSTVRLLRNLGIGGAVQTGIKYAAAHQFDFCVQIDGDGQHPPSEIAKLLAAYRQNRSAIIIGSRYLLHDSFRSTFARRMGTKAIAGLLNLLFKHSCITDSTSGMRLMDRRAIAFFADAYPHDFPEPISIAWALKEGLPVSECSVVMRPRGGGRSSISGLKSLAYMLRVFGYIILTKFIGLRKRS